MSPLLSPTTTIPPRPQNTCSVSSEGKWQSGVSGETQRNHRAYLSLLPLTLNYSLKPPEFFLNKILQSATQDCWSHIDTPTDQTGRVGSGGLSCNIEKSETEWFFFFFLVEFSWNLCSGFKAKEGGEASTFSLRGLIGEQTTQAEMNGSNLNPKSFATGCVTESDVSFRH